MTTAPVDAWDLTRRISPRKVVRIAQREATGEITNSYPLHCLTSAAEPDVPWAVCLAGDDGRFRLLAFDFDDANPYAEPLNDAARLEQMCAEVGIPVVVAASRGPDHPRRHVWIGLADAIAAPTIAQLARAAKAVLPTLDISPLTNPRTGCVRPPGSPHRCGARSQTVAGDPHSLTRPTVTRARLLHLAARLDDALASRPSPPALTHPPAPARDAEGRRCLPRAAAPRRPLPGPSVASLTTAVPTGADASVQMWIALLGCVRAGWSHADVAALLDTAPGLEHARTEAQPNGARRPHPQRRQHQILAHMWDAAVDRVAASTRLAASGDIDPGLARRITVVEQTIHAVQERADAMPGRWNGAGAAQRRVLDAICLLACQAHHLSLELPVRHLSATTGIGRTTVHHALAALAADGYLHQTRPGSGQKGARWRIHISAHLSRTQGGTPPSTSQPVRQILDRRLNAGRHDAFATPGKPGMRQGLGTEAGTAWARLQEGDIQVGAVPPAIIANLIDEGLLTGCVEVATGEISYRTRDQRDQVAAERGLTGTLAGRWARYRLEQHQWAWWQRELLWLGAPRGQKPLLKRYQPALIDPTQSRYPRRRNGCPDHPAALNELRDGMPASTTAVELSAAA